MAGRTGNRTFSSSQYNFVMFKYMTVNLSMVQNYTIIINKRRFDVLNDLIYL